MFTQGNTTFLCSASFASCAGVLNQMPASTSHLRGASQSLCVVGTQEISGAQLWGMCSAIPLQVQEVSLRRLGCAGGSCELGFPIQEGISHQHQPALAHSAAHTLEMEGASVPCANTFHYWNLFRCSEITTSAENLQRSCEHVAQVLVLSWAFKWPVLWVHTLQRVAARLQCRILKSKTLEMREVRGLW